MTAPTFLDLLLPRPVIVPFAFQLTRDLPNYHRICVLPVECELKAQPELAL